MIGLTVDALLDQPANQKQLEEALRALRARPLVCLALKEDLEFAKKELAQRGFVIRRESRYELPFFSSFTRFDIVALELEAPPPHPVPVEREARVPSAGEPGRPPASPDGGREDAGLLGSIDSPVDGAEVRGTLVVSGWARVTGQDLTVRVLLDGVERKADEFRRTSRPDVAAAVPELGSCATAGYEARVVPRPEEAGPHELAVVFRSNDGRERHYPGRRITIVKGP